VSVVSDAASWVMGLALTVDDGPTLA